MESNVLSILGEEMRGVVGQNDVGEEGSDSFTDGRLVRVPEGDKQDEFVRTGFLKAISGLGLQSAAEAIYKNTYSGVTWQAKLRSFLHLSRHVGYEKVKLGWFGGSKDEISNIFRYGFASEGCGVCLSPFDDPAASLHACVADENGLYHMILCSAILGKPELLHPCAAQRFPTSDDCYSGADNLASPRVYVVWSSYMSTHITPQYVVSFRPPVPVANARRRDEPLGMLPFSRLIRELALVLPATDITRLQKLNDDVREGRISKQGMKRMLRSIAGDQLLKRAIMSIRRNGGPSAPQRSSAAEVLNK